MKLDKTRGSLENKEEEDLSRRRQSRNISPSLSLSLFSFRCQPSLVVFIKATGPDIERYDEKICNRRNYTRGK